MTAPVAAQDVLSRVRPPRPSATTHSGSRRTSSHYAFTNTLSEGSQKVYAGTTSRRLRRGCGHTACSQTSHPAIRRRGSTTGTKAVRRCCSSLAAKTTSCRPRCSTRMRSTTSRTPSRRSTTSRGAPIGRAVHLAGRRSPTTRLSGRRNTHDQDRSSALLRPPSTNKRLRDVGLPVPAGSPMRRGSALLWRLGSSTERRRTMSFVSRGFRGRRSDSDVDASRVPPGQYLTDDFPVLSAGPTPHTPLEEWTFAVVSGDERKSWSWDEFRTLPSETLTADIHCVTRWSKLRHDVGRSVGGHAPGRRRARRPLPARVLRRGLHDESPARGRHGREGAVHAGRLSTTSRSSPSTAVLPACSSPTCTSGRARSGCVAWSSATRTSPASGRRTATA